MAQAMEKITSVQNPLVKEFVKAQQKKYRDEKGILLLEGEKTLNAAKEAGLEVLHIFTLENSNEKIMEKISTSKSAPRVVAIAKKPRYSLETFKKFKKIALLEGIKDAGNLGTIVRAACAFGIEGILLKGECVDEFAPNTLRATAGNAFKIPVLHIDSLQDFKKTHALYATVVKGGKVIENIDFGRNFILMFGAEAEGLSKELIHLADEKVTLNIKNDVESLNLALCAGIFFWEMSK